MAIHNATCRSATYWNHPIKKMYSPKLKPVGSKLSVMLPASFSCPPEPFRVQSQTPTTKLCSESSRHLAHQEAFHRHALPNFGGSTSGPKRLDQGLGLFFTAHLQCPVLFLGTVSFPADTGALFPNRHFNEMAPKVLLSIYPEKPAFLSTCSQNDG